MLNGFCGTRGRRPLRQARPGGGRSVFAERLLRDPAGFVAWVTVVAFSVCVHETAHAWCAWSQGDDTAVRHGYGDLNPRVLMGWPSLLALVLFGIAWGAVPVVPARFRHRWSEALVACSGPASNLVLAALFGTAYMATARFAPGARPLLLVFGCGLDANCLLAVLNMLPIPPFDGWAAARFLMPGLGRVSPERLGLVSWVAIVVLFVTPASGVVHGIAGAIAGVIARAAQAVVG